MKWFILLFMGVLLLSCQGKSSSGTDSDKQVSVPDTVLAYKYKESGEKTDKFELKIRGNNKTKQGNLTGGIEDYTMAILIDTLYDSAYFNRANNLMKLGANNEALADYNKSIRINPHFLEAYINRGILKSKMGDIEGELSDYRIAIKKCEPNANLYNNLGRALYDLERFKESAEAYGEGIKHFPKDYRLYYGRGLARKRIGDKKGACEDWMKSSELGCVQANILLPLCDEYMKERTDSLKRQNEGKEQSE